MGEPQVIDRPKLDMLRHELGSNFARILGYFCEDGARSVHAIEEAVRQRSAAALVNPAHTLKGEALQFGAQALGRLSESIEMQGRTAVEDHVFPSGVVEDVVKLRPLFDQALELLLHESSAPPAQRKPAAFGRKVIARA